MSVAQGGDAWIAVIAVTTAARGEGVWIAVIAVTSVARGDGVRIAVIAVTRVARGGGVRIAVLGRRVAAVSGMSMHSGWQSIVLLSSARRG